MMCFETCPTCKKEVDLLFDEVVACKKCGAEGATDCCFPEGAGKPCQACADKARKQ
jgi:hypothetical protein